MTQLTLWLLERTRPLLAAAETAPDFDLVATPFVCLRGQLVGSPQPWYTLSAGQFLSWSQFNA
jgi:hypothetical protein